jgi:hypothetical protein
MTTYGIAQGEAPKRRHQIDPQSARFDRSLCGKHVVIMPDSTLYTDDCQDCLRVQMQRSGR